MLPWPPSILSPNSHVHWRKKGPAAKKYRVACGWLAKVAGLRVTWEGTVHVWITFFPPDRRHRDDDNLIGALKAGRDGVADALGINDKRFRIHPMVSDQIFPGGQVRIRLSCGADERGIEDAA